MLMAAARLNIPAIFLNGGPMYPAEYKGKHYDGNIVTEAVGWKKQGKIDEQEFRYIENIAEPCAGSCAMIGTANSRAVLPRLWECPFWLCNDTCRVSPKKQNCF